MSWVREDDGEVLDAKVGKLKSDEYRELHALRQYVAREHAGAGGIFTKADAVSAVYLTPKGARSVSAATLRRLLELGLVRDVHSYSAGELADLDAEGRNSATEAAADIRMAQIEGAEGLRMNRWERYAVPRDRTRNERQQRYKARNRADSEDGSRESNAVSNAVGNDVRARVTRPVPSLERSSTPTASQDAGSRDDLDFNGALRVARLLQAIGDVGLDDADDIRGLASRASEATVAKLLESLAAGGVRDRVAYVKTTLRNEAR